MDGATAASPPNPTPSFVLDPSDPLSMLIHSQHLSDDEDSAMAQPDWSELSAALWAAGADPSAAPPLDGTLGMKPDPVEFDFSQFASLSDFSLGADMSIDPSALYLGDPTAALAPDAFAAAFNLPKTPGDTSNGTATPFPITFPFPPTTPVDGTNRRLSVGSSSSSSGASLSPVLSHSSASSQYGDSHEQQQQLKQHQYQLQQADLAALISQLAGAQAHVQAGWSGLTTQAAQAKLPIPRLKQQPFTVSPTSTSTRASSPQTASSTAAPSSPSTAPAPAPAPAGRQKTDHTTIERRYRTNLNVRIQSLKNAVPALRVLERKDGSGDDASGGDAVDARGFVDGVKVARKISKANVLGKAVEYIRVLKKREARLRREQDGLRALVCGAVAGGQQLLEAWEMQWRTEHGGEEKDEVEGEEAMEDEEDDGDDDDDEGRARKKPKVTKSAPKPFTAAAASASSTQTKKPAAPKPVLPVDPATGLPEKRKRGRPRKLPILEAPVPPPVVAAVTVSAQEGEQQQQQAPQYLLAVFAFFSFFNSPLTSSYASQHQAHAHEHHGSVLTHNPHPTVNVMKTPAGGVTLHDVVQVVHLFVSLAVFASIVVPWLPSFLRRNVLTRWTMRAFPFSEPASTATVTTTISAPILKRTDSSSSASSSADESPDGIDKPKSPRGQARAALSAALAPARRGAKDEREALYAALGVRPGLVGMAAQAVWSRKVVSYAGDRGLELRQLEQRAWVRIGELVALDESASAPLRLQAYLSMRSRIAPYLTSPSDLCTLALLLRPLSPSKSASLWTQARSAASASASSSGASTASRTYERHVLTEFDVHSAAARLRGLKAIRTPLIALGCDVMRDRLRRHAAALFVASVESAGGASGWEDEAAEEDARALTLEAGVSLGGGVRIATERFDRVWRNSGSGAVVVPSVPNAPTEGEEDVADVRALLDAVVLYRRLFPSTTLLEPGALPGVVVSPPSSDGLAERELQLALRSALDADVFYARDWDNAARGEDGSTAAMLGMALEDARDCVVDLLVERERAGVRRSVD